MNVDLIALIATASLCFAMGLYVIITHLVSQYKTNKKIREYFSTKNNDEFDNEHLRYDSREIHCFPCECSRKQNCWRFWLTYHAYKTKTKNYTLWTPTSNIECCDRYHPIRVIGIIPD